MIPVLSFGLLFMTACYFLAAYRLRQYHVNTENWQAVEHSKCMALIASFVGDSFAAQVLRVAADDYDSADEIHRKKVLAQDYVEHGPSLPSMWLRDRAANILPEEGE